MLFWCGNKTKSLWKIGGYMETVKIVNQIELPDGTILKFPDSSGGGD